MSAEKAGNPQLSEWFGPQVLGRRKTARPFAANREMEALFQSRLARGKWALNRPPHANQLCKLLRMEASRANIDLLKIENGGDHFLLRFRAEDRTELARFFRVVGGKIPRLVAGAEKSRPLSDPRGKTTGAARKFWDGLVATRIL